MDSAFVSGFAGYGLSSGLEIDTNRKALKHEGIYSMFMREFLRHYADIDSLPAYRPDGLKIYE